MLLIQNDDQHLFCILMINKQKKPSRDVLSKRCSESMEQIYRRAPIPRCDSIKFLCKLVEITLRHECSPVNLLHTFRTAFTKNTYAKLLLNKIFYTWFFHFNNLKKNFYFIASYFTAQMHMLFILTKDIAEKITAKA